MCVLYGLLQTARKQDTTRSVLTPSILGQKKSESAHDITKENLDTFANLTDFVMESLMTDATMTTVAGGIRQVDPA